VRDDRHVRAEELDFTRGDAAKARALLGWSPEVSYEEMLDEMIDYWRDRLQGERKRDVVEGKSTTRAIPARCH
jgi:GDP-D-mannose dehydratase